MLGFPAILLLKLSTISLSEITISAYKIFLAFKHAANVTFQWNSFLSLQVDILSSPFQLLCCLNQWWTEANLSHHVSWEHSHDHSFTYMVQWYNWTLCVCVYACVPVCNLTSQVVQFLSHTFLYHFGSNTYFRMLN